MKIKEITSQNRRDFTAIIECDHTDCDGQDTINGYDDAHYHQNVIPDIKCLKCKRTAPESHKPIGTKYPEWRQV